MRVALLGAGGTIAPAIVRDLAASEEVEDIHCLDLDGERASAVAAEQGEGRARGRAVDATDRDALAATLAHADVLVNAASYRINLHAMDACLAAGCHYVDLGGLYHLTARQLGRDEAFADRGLVAVLGAGAGPGKTNVLAAAAADGLDAVDEVRCASAGLDEDPPPGLSTPYALATLLDEMTVPPMVVRGGRAQEVPPLSDGGEVAFPAPLGTRGSLLTLHSEVLTLPTSLGAARADFRLSLSPAVEEALRGLLDRPAEEVAALRPVPPSPRTWSAQHVEVSGTRDGAPARVVATSVTPPHEAWGIGGGILSTGSVAAATVRLLAQGRVDGIGALAPERCLPARELFTELARRGTSFRIIREPSAAAGAPVPSGSPEAAVAIPARQTPSEVP